MKNLSIVCVVVVALWIGKCTQKNEKFTDLLFEKNVEALAGVDDNWYCVGEKYTCLVDSQGEIKGKRYTIQ